MATTTTKPDHPAGDNPEEARKTLERPGPQKAPVHPRDRDESKEGLVGGKYGQQNPQLKPA